MSKKKTSNIAEQATGIYIFAIMVLYILYPGKDYFDIVDVKYNMLMVISTIYLVFQAIAISFNKVSGIKSEKKYGAVHFVLRCLVFGMIGCILVSSALSGYQSIVWNGDPDRRSGTIIYLVMIVSGIVAACTVAYKKIYADVLIAVACIEGLWVMTDFFNMDIFSMHVNIHPGFSYLYVGSIGQITVTSSLFCMSFPILIMSYFYEQDKKKRLIYHVALIIHIFSIYTVLADSAVLVFAATLLFLPIFVFGSLDGIKRYIIFIIEFLVSGMIIGIIINLIGFDIEAMADGWWKLIVTDEYFNSKRVVVFLLLVLAGLYYYEKMQKSKGKSFKWEKSAIWCSGFAGLVIVAVMSVVFYFSVIDTTSNIGYTMASYVRFDDDWGTDRGFVWRKVVEAYGSESVINQLFGTGADTTGYELNRIFGAEAYTDAGEGFDNAHNTILQYLLTYGILFDLTYLTFIIYMVYNLFKNGNKNNKDAAIIACGILGYVLQSLVGLNQIFTAPVYILLFAFGYSIVDR